MQRKTIVRTLLALATCAATSFGAQAQTTKLTLGHGAAPGNPRHEAAVLLPSGSRPRPTAASRSRSRTRRSWATTPR